MITLQLLACHQQKRETDNLFEFLKTSIFERNKLVHSIIDDGDVNKFKNFIKYSNCNILNDYNENGQSLLHAAVSKMNFDMIKIFLDGCELGKCFDMAYCEHYNFVNHKSNTGDTPFEILLKTNIETNSEDERKAIFELFIKCDTCEID